MKRLLFIFFPFVLVAVTRCYGQSDPEFPKGFIMHLKLHNGMVTDFKSSPDLYAGGVQLVPQVTVVEHLLRVGIIADGLYTGKKIQAAAGPNLSLKIATIYAGIFGSAANINVNFDHLWATEHETLIGGGINADLGNLIVIGLSAHRDYHFHTWWFQNSIGVRISKKVKPVDIINQ